MEKTLQLRSSDEARQLYGERDRFLKMIRNHYDVKINARNGDIRITGDESSVLDAYGAMLLLVGRLRENGRLGTRDVESALLGREAKNKSDNGEEEEDPDRLDPFEPRTEGQKAYVESIRANSITFGVGPAGSGKTFLAVACAVTALVRGEVRRLVLVRPAVEAGEKLGFLPGDFQAKVNPYLRPIFDALSRVMPPAQVAHYLERDIIEVAPLAFMRGRTLDNAFVILDEAQNATPKQMLMFLTRLGAHSKAVITGDMSQTDLEFDDMISGLEDAVNKLDGIEDIALCRLTKDDIVRHKLIRQIIDAYGE